MARLRAGVRGVGKSRRGRFGRGFTLVELLVVITIIGILMGMMLPAVMMVMNNARRTQCLNNIKQICTAMQSYHTAQGKFPMNYGKVPQGQAGTLQQPGSATMNTGDSTVGQSWITAILPDMEETPLQQQIAPGQPLGYKQNGLNNMAAAQTPIKTLICPSDTQKGTLSNQAIANNVLFGVTNYKAVAGSNWNGDGSQNQFKTCKADRKDPVTGKPYGGRNRTAYDGLDTGDGIICRGGSVMGGPRDSMIVRLDDVTKKDGASRTLAVGESLPQYSAWSAWYWFDGSTATCAVPLNFCINSGRPEQYTNNWRLSYSFMSQHKGGANFGACDASGHFIADSIDIDVYRGLATTDGGENVDIP
jgi:prepilin-type N-terminal cleavage/methylation domain-containing protein